MTKLLGFESPGRLKPRQHLSTGIGSSSRNGSGSSSSINRTGSLSLSSSPITSTMSSSLSLKSDRSHGNGNSHSHNYSHSHNHSHSHSHSHTRRNHLFHDTKSNDNEDDQDDNKSLTDTVMQMWRKHRRRNRSSSNSRHYHRHRKGDDHIKFLNLAKALVLLFFFSWSVQYYQTLPPSSPSLVDVDANVDHLNVPSSLALEGEGHLLIQQQGSASDIDSTSNIDIQSKQIMPDHVREVLKKKLEKSHLREKLDRIREAEVNVPRLALKPTRIREHNPSITIPTNIDSFYRDIVPLQLQQSLSLSSSSGDVPVFWHILKSGGTTIKDLFGQCMAKVEASEAGILNGHINDSTLQTITFPHSGIQYVNVDTSTAPGIERAIRMNLVQSGMAEIIFTPLLHESSQLFNHTSINQKGKIFALFRHPVERAVSLFHYLKKATWEPTFSEKLKKINSVEDYAISEFAEDNWMVRFLTNKMTQMVTRDDLDVAKEILRRKVIVGLVIDIRGAIERFLTYLRWNYNDLTLEQKQCMNRYLASGSNKNAHEIVEEGTMGWRILKANNLLDLELYDYALQLYEEQGRLLGVAPK